MARCKRSSVVDFPGNANRTPGKRIYDEQALVSAATRFLLDHLSQDVSAEQLALCFDVTEERLIRAFDINLGMTVQKYLLQERMFLAQRLLLQTSLSIGTIADKVGFAYGSYFSKTFRSYFGATPWEFRNNPPDAAITAFQGSVLWG